MKRRHQALIIQYENIDGETKNHIFWDGSTSSSWDVVSWQDLLMRRRVKKIIAKFKIHLKSYC